MNLGLIQGHIPLHETGAPPVPGEEQPRHKRNRILLSCAPCRASKLKCDRQQPCGQCAKKDRSDACEYAPKPEKKGRRRRRPAPAGGVDDDKSRGRPAPKDVTSRLKHLEGVVRDMMGAQSEGAGEADGGPSGPPGTQKLRGQVIRGQNQSTAYVGETHCMAMLEDIQDLQAYFDDSDSDDEHENSPFDYIDEPDLLVAELGSASVSRQDLLAQLPDKGVTDRLVTRYWECQTPSQYVVHKGQFQRMYARFWQDPDDAPLHWIAQLFMVLSLGVYYSRYQATSELERDSPEPAGERVRRYRACAGWALVTGKYMQPGPWTLGAVVLYLGSHLHLNRATQMSSYVLSGVCIRLMLKMGLHRDPSRLAGISAFEGEMRRRLWNQAIVLETLVSFHVGLPGMASLIDADAELPRNLQDDDLDEDMVELPPSRPPGDWTPVTYAAVKRTIMDVFGHISREAHALSPPEYGDVMRLDADLQAAWARVPPVMRVRSVDESIGDPPALIVQRFGIASLYNKSRCVLHRRYLAEGAGSTSGAPGAKPPLRQHDYSRQQCLDAAVSLLRSQSLIWKLSGPGNTLAAHRWFVSSLSVHDFLLAAMVVYYIIQSEHYENPDSPVVWVAPGGSGSGGGSGSDGGNGIKEAPSKDELRGLIYTSYLVWSDLAESSAEVRRTADTLALILARLGTPVEGHQSQQARKNASTAPTVLVSADAAASAGVSSVGSNGAWSTPDFDASGASSDAVGTSSLHGPVSNISLNDSSSGFDDTFPAVSMGGATAPMSTEAGPGFALDAAWFGPEIMDWRGLDISLAHSHTSGGQTDGPGTIWTERTWPAGTGPEATGTGGDMADWMMAGQHTST